MAWCAAFNCSNTKRRDKDKSFFSLPSDESVKRSWIAAIKRSSLPKQVFVCSDHFEENCFSDSWKLENDLYYKDRPARRQLKKGSIPTIFPHKELPTERLSSKIRIEKLQAKQVFLNSIFALIISNYKN